jgi:hypothetical protein
MIMIVIYNQQALCDEDGIEERWHATTNANTTSLSWRRTPGIGKCQYSATKNNTNIYFIQNNILLYTIFIKIWCVVTD